MTGRPSPPGPSPQRGGHTGHTGHNGHRAASRGSTPTGAALTPPTPSESGYLSPLMVSGVYVHLDGTRAFVFQPDLSPVVCSRRECGRTLTATEALWVTEYIHHTPAGKPDIVGPQRPSLARLPVCSPSCAAAVLAGRGFTPEGEVPPSPAVQWPEGLPPDPGEEDPAW
jgi:hypothetical protein